MRILFFNPEHPPRILDAASYHLKYKSQNEIYRMLANAQCDVHVVQRAPFYCEKITEDVFYHFIRDEYPEKLHWAHEPVKAQAVIKKVQPEIIHIFGLGIPLQYRWLRRAVGKKAKIIGQNCGDKIWANKNIWLQQFGLRVVNAFLFAPGDNPEPWQRASLILPRQMIFCLPYHWDNISGAVEQLKEIYKTTLAAPVNQAQSPVA